MFFATLSSFNCQMFVHFLLFSHSSFFIPKYSVLTNYKYNTLPLTDVIEVCPLFMNHLTQFSVFLNAYNHRKVCDSKILVIFCLMRILDFSFLFVFVFFFFIGFAVGTGGRRFQDKEQPCFWFRDLLRKRREVELEVADVEVLFGRDTHG